MDLETKRLFVALPALVTAVGFEPCVSGGVPLHVHQQLEALPTRVSWPLCKHPLMPHQGAEVPEARPHCGYFWLLHVGLEVHRWEYHFPHFTQMNGFSPVREETYETCVNI